jgi:hypothetical protein
MSDTRQTIVRATRRPAQQHARNDKDLCAAASLTARACHLGNRAIPFIDTFKSRGDERTAQAANASAYLAIEARDIARQSLVVTHSPADRGTQQTHGRVHGMSRCPAVSISTCLSWLTSVNPKNPSQPVTTLFNLEHRRACDLDKIDQCIRTARANGPAGCACVRPWLHEGISRWQTNSGVLREGSSVLTADC